MPYRLTRNKDWYIAQVHDANCVQVSSPPLSETYETIGEALYAGANTKGILVAREAGCRGCPGGDVVAVRANRD